MQTTDFDKVLALVHEAGALFMDDNAAHNITVKGLADYATQVDLRVQSFIKERLLGWYPDIAFMGEEGEDSQVGDAKAFWILDPVDGTTNLIHNYRHSAISLALCEDNEIVFGIVYQPYTKDTFRARKGQGAFLNELPIHVSGSKTLGDSIVTIGTSPYNKELAHKNFELFERIFMKTQDIRRSGSAALDLAYVACGRLDGFFERNLKPWDFAAGALLITEAGGKLTTFRGTAVDFKIKDDILADNGLVHEELLEEIKQTFDFS